MTAPDLRPTATTDSAAPMETGPDHQLEHQIGGEVVARLFDNDGKMVAEFDHAQGCFTDEPLAKVLPAGGPLQPRRDFPEWECSGCGLRSTRPALQQCLHGHNNCPMVARP